MLKMSNWFTTKFRPHSTHLFNIILSKSDKDCKSEAEKNNLADAVRNDLEHLHQGFKILNEAKAQDFILNYETPTILDIMIYNEISQVLHLYGLFRSSSTSARCQELRSKNPDWDEAEELSDYQMLAKWYNKTMKSCEAFQFIKKWD